MLKKVFFTFHFSLFTILCFAQNSDPIVMTVGGVPVTKSEFEYNYNKNNTDAVIDKKSVKDYADLFAVYKMKVLAALDAKMDTVASYQKEFRQYRDQAVRPLLVSDTAVEQECHKYYDGMLKQLGGKDLIQPAHIFLLLKQNASTEDQERVKTRIDSIHAALKAGADFAETAKKLSDDKQTGMHGGVLPWIGPGNTIKEFEDAAYALKVGEMSTPVQSPVGYHIIKMIARKQLEPFDTLHSQIHAFLERRGVREQLANAAIDSIRLKYDSTYTVDQVMDAETERLCAKDMDLKYLVKEYHDGLLLYNLCSEKIWEPAKVDTLGLQNYFKANKKQYAWNTPHYNGMLYYCKNQTDVPAVARLLKKTDDSRWIAVIREKFNKDSVTVRMDKRLFTKGDNKMVDSLVFKVKGVGAQPMSKFPYAGVVGKVLKKGPAKWTDVSAQVVQDYQKKKEDEFVTVLRAKYPVTVDEAVLATVNEKK